jgi:hypothetical protein
MPSTTRGRWRIDPSSVGTWGVGIFSDDLASDVRGDWRDAIADGLSPEAATARILERYAESRDDSDEATRFWTALAAAQAASGRLQDHVRDEALRLIEAGGDVSLFAEEDPDQGTKRNAVLQKLATQLRGPQRAPTRIVKPKAQISPVGVGDVIEVTGSSAGRRAYFAVVGLDDGWPPGSTWPVLVGLGWREEETPTLEQLRDAPLVRDDRGMGGGGPVVDYLTLIGPTRGPRHWANFARVIGTGLERPDAPDWRDEWKVGRGSMAWDTLADWIDTEWYDRRMDRTFHPRKPRRWPWSRR